MTNVSVINSLFSFIESKAQKKYYPYYLGILLMLCSWFFVFPRFVKFDPNYITWQTVILKSNDLTNTLSHLDPISNYSKKVFRLTIPVIMRIAHLTPLAVIVLQCFIGYLIYVFSYKLTNRILNDTISATFLTAGLAFIYFGRAAYFDIDSTWFDAFAYFFLIMALYSRNLFAIFSFSTLAAWTDERAFIALSIVFLFHQLKDNFEKKINLKSLIKLKKESIIVIVAMLFYLGVRMLLSYQYNMHTPSEGANLSVLKKTLPLMSTGIWTFFEGFWLIYLLVILHTFINKNNLALILFTLPMIVFFIISGCVWDITRSGSYLVPMIFILIYYLRDYQSKNDLRQLLLVCFVVSFLYPPTLVMAIGRNIWIGAPSLFQLVIKML